MSGERSSHSSSGIRPAWLNGIVTVLWRILRWQESLIERRRRVIEKRNSASEPSA